MGIEVCLCGDIAFGFAKKLNSNLHSHLALQLTLSLDGCFDVHRPASDEALTHQSVAFACFAPGELHQVMTTELELVYLYVECDIRTYTRWCNAGGNPIPPSVELLNDLRRLYQSSSRDRDRIHTLAQEWRMQSLPGLMYTPPSNPRIARIVEHVNTAPLDMENHVTLAQRAHLSPSRFAHLFKQQTGLPVRNYLLWRRLLLALKCIEGGHSFTTAAHEAGFADSAHLSRSFRRVFGAMPTDMKIHKAA